MKKILLMILCLVTLGGCSVVEKPEVEETPSLAPTSVPTSLVSPTPSLVEEKFLFTEENYPRVDGSTATIPLIEAVECALLGKSRTDVIVNVSKTSGAYEALAEGEVDVLLVYDGGEDTRKKVNADELFETVPIGKDALVFLVNKDNPVENLTTEQVRKIFSGEYTNWSQLGGSDELIRAYQRGISSGSQALMDKLVMKELPMAGSAKVQVIESMGGLIDAVADFVGGPTGIGYNVFYYVTEMRKNNYIKLLSIDGVEPTYESIQSGEYPFVSEFYSVIRKSEPKGSPARALHEWMLSDEAQNLMSRESYVALRTNPDADTPYVDGEYAMYPKGEEPVYFTGTNPYALMPSKEYGKLYFYLGSIYNEMFSSPQFYGLCTEDGKIVTEPIYTIATLLTDSKGNAAYLCFRSDLGQQTETVEEGAGYERTISNPAILFATDGSWIQEYDGAQFCYGFNGVIDAIINADFIAVKKDGKWGAVDMNGEVVIPFDRNSPDGIYGQPDFENGEMMFRITANRYLSHETLYDETANHYLSYEKLYDETGKVIADDIKGMLMTAAGDYFVTTYYDEETPMVIIYTYTLDGNLLAELKSSSELVQGVSAFGEYVLTYLEDRIKIYDRQLKELSEIPLRFDERNNYYAYMLLGEGVLHDLDVNTKFHRTYLPDGRRLVTWYDPDMWEDFSHFNQ